VTSVPKRLAAQDAAGHPPPSNPLDFLASTLADVVDAEEAIQTIVSVAAATVGTSFAGITLIHDDGASFETVGATHASVAAADRLQYTLGEGPCVLAARDATSFVSHDLAGDPRWPTWGPAVTALGFQSIVSAELHGRGHRIGALNLYGPADTEFTEHDFEMVKQFAHEASAVLAFALQEDHLLRAMEARSVIGQAQGVIMERFKIGATTAFAVLRRYSMDSNTRLRDLAEYVVEMRDLPADEPHGLDDESGPLS
jgi:GAF domain-containing protein